MNELGQLQLKGWSEAPLEGDERFDRLLLWCVEKIGPVRYRALLEHFNSATEAIRAGPRSCAAVLKSDYLAEVLSATWPNDAFRKRLYREIQRLELTTISSDEPDYPAGLTDVGEPPWLFVAGNPDALHEPLAAIVGTRGVRADGIRLTRQVVRWCGEGGWATVSGGALGVDTEVHRSSLDEEIPTVAVMPAGLAQLAPSSNRALFDSVCEAGGCLLSEAPPWRQPRPELFARRNRLISGLSVITIVVRAPRKSGALITAEWAWRQGRPVYVVPGAPDDPTAAGCLEAMRRGGRMLAESADLPAANGLATRSRPKLGRAADVAPVPSAFQGVLACLSNGPVSIDELVDRLGERPELVVEQLSMLLLDGRIEQIGPGLYKAC